MDQDLWMKALHFHGAPLLKTVLGETPDVTHDIDNEKLTICRFIKSKLNLLFQPSESTTDPPADCSLPIVPIEVFRNASPQERRDLFYKSLDRGNIITLRVINDSLLDDYKLLALCKDDCDMKLDDLSLIMYLPKLPAELNLAGGVLQSNDLIRAAVCSCDIDNRKLNVTLGSNILEDPNVKLGKISESDLPLYVGNFDFGSSYVEYLHNSRAFKNPNWSKELHKAFNLEQNYLYSFLEGLDGKKYPAEVYGRELKKKQDLISSNLKVVQGKQCHANGQFAEAFLYLNSALVLFPENIEALVARGTLFANTNNLKKAFNDIEQAIRIDANHEGAKTQMSILLVAAARMHMDKNDFKRAQESLEAALHLDNNNGNAVNALEEIRQRQMAGSSSDLDKTARMLEKKARIGSGSSGSSCSRKEEPKEKHTLEAHTKLFLSSLRRSHKDKSKKHHHSRKEHKEKDPSRSPKQIITID